MATILKGPTAMQVATAPDWSAWVKLSAIVVMFLASGMELLFGHPTPATAQYANDMFIATGITIGVMGLANVAANIANVRAILNSPSAQAAGLIPSPVSTPISVSSTSNGGAKP